MCFYPVSLWNVGCWKKPFKHHFSDDHLWCHGCNTSLVVCLWQKRLLAPHCGTSMGATWQIRLNAHDLPWCKDATCQIWSRFAEKMWPGIMNRETDTGSSALQMACFTEVWESPKGIRTRCKLQKLKNELYIKLPDLTTLLTKMLWTTGNGES